MGAGAKRAGLGSFGEKPHSPASGCRFQREEKSNDLVDFVSACPFHLLGSQRPCQFGGPALGDHLMLRTSFVALAFAVLLYVPSDAAKAESSVEVDGLLHTCSKRCVVKTNGRGAFSVRDCCGGRVRVVFVRSR
jgi:hypothetical protein